MSRRSLYRYDSPNSKQVTFQYGGERCGAASLTTVSVVCICVPSCVADDSLQSSQPFSADHHVPLRIGSLQGCDRCHIAGGVFIGGSEKGCSDKRDPEQTESDPEPCEYDCAAS